MSTVRTLVLGIVRRHKKLHGYRVYSEILSWKANTWTVVKPGSIYHALTRLEKEGFLQSIITENSKDGPERTIFKLTKTGESEFQRLVENLLMSIQIDHMSVGLAFMNELPRVSVIEALKKRSKELEKTYTFLRTLPTDTSLQDPSKNPELIGVWISSLDNSHKWTNTLIKKLEDEEYKFIDEK